jgi:hypothetical protein
VLRSFAFYSHLQVWINSCGGEKERGDGDFFTRGEIIRDMGIGVA